MVILLSMIGMFCWGITPIFVKLALKDLNPQVGLFIRTIFTIAIITGWIFISGNLKDIKKISFNSIMFLAIEAFLATIIGDLAYYAAIKKGAVSIVTIIMASSPFVTIICSILFLNENLTISRFFGACLVIFGTVLVVDKND